MTAEKTRATKLRRYLESARPKSLLETQALERQINDLATAHERGLVWNEEEAQRAIDFFSLLRHWKGEWAGQRFELEDWQSEAIIAPVFGWIREDGTRRFRTVYIEIPRKNGKTTLSSGIGLKMLIADLEEGAQVYSAATTRDQAKICYTDSGHMCRQSPELSEHVEVLKTAITCASRNSTYKPLSSDYGTLDGLDIHCAVIDELHAHKTRDLYDVLKTATGARRQPLIWMITTAGFDRHSVCYEQRLYAQRVLEGSLHDDSFFAYVACADEGDDWTDPQTWWKANPNLRISLKEDTIREDCLAAQENPAAENTFKRLHLNLWTEQETRFIPMNKWDACDTEVDAEALKGRKCYAGLDLSTRYDLTCLSLVFPPIEAEEPYKVLPFFFIPADEMRERERKDHVDYSVWARQGFVDPTPGDIVDHEYVKAKAVSLKEDYDILEVAFDRWGAVEISTAMDRAGFVMVPFGQGYGSMGGPTKELLALILGGRFAHGGHPVLRWNASAVTVKQDPAGNVKPIKPERMKSANRIDGIVATIMALDRAIRNESEVGPSIYETQGLLVL